MYGEIVFFVKKWEKKSFLIELCGTQGPQSPASGTAEGAPGESRKRIIKNVAQPAPDAPRLVLFYSDSNQDKQDQNLLCYHYTIEQADSLFR